MVNRRDGDLREARDWVEYCNGTTDTALARLRAAHGYPEPHRIRYWGIGNEVDGHWQIGAKTATEYARAYHEFAKVMRWTDPRFGSSPRPLRTGMATSWSAPSSLSRKRAT